VEQHLPIGTRAELTVAGDRQTTNAGTATINPAYGSSIRLALTQPLHSPSQQRRLRDPEERRKSLDQAPQPGRVEGAQAGSRSRSVHFLNSCNFSIY